MPRPIVYLNADITTADANDPSVGRRKPAVASKEVVRSGPFLPNPQDYYAAVYRLAVSLDLPIFIGQMQLPSPDGVSLVSRIALQAVIGGTTYRGSAYLQLDRTAAQAARYVGITAQPLGEHAFVWDRAALVRMLNAALQAAYAALIIDGAVLNPAQAPFYSLEENGRLRLTAYPYSLWAYDGQEAAAADRCRIYCNAPGTAVIASGFEWDFVQPENAALDPNGEDALIRLTPDGSNYEPQPPVPTGIDPADKALSNVHSVQSFTPVYPGVASVQLVSSLPAQAEYTSAVQYTSNGTVASTSSSQTTILSDFIPSFDDPAFRTSIYNAGLGTARYYKLNGEVPLQSFSLALQTVDWQGVTRPLKFYSQNEGASVKIAFVPEELLAKQGSHSREARSSVGANARRA